MSALRPQERYLLHQVHPLKLATDVAASIVSDVLFWKHRLGPGVVVLLGPSVVVTTILLRQDIPLNRDSGAARYVLQHMPPSMQAVRAASAVVTAIAAWRRSPGLLGVGYALTLAGWSHGVLRRP
jgi:hypothetical protein